MYQPCPALTQVFVADHYRVLRPIGHDEFDLAPLADASKVVRLIEDSAAKCVALDSDDRDPNCLCGVASDARSTIVHKHLQVVRVVREKSPLQFWVITPGAAH